MSMDYGRSMKPFFSLKYGTFALGQTNLADELSDLEKTKPYIHIPNIFWELEFEYGLQRIRDLTFVCP